MDHAARYFGGGMEDQQINQGNHAAKTHDFPRIGTY